MTGKRLVELDEIIEAFTNYIGLAPTPGKQQRQYAGHIYRMCGTKTNDIVAYAISIQSDPYAPVVTSPKDLYYNLSKVMAYYKRNEAESNGKVVQL